VPYSDLDIVFEGYYSGNPAHDKKFRIWNYQTSNWDNVTIDADDLPSGVSDVVDRFPFPGTKSDYVSGSQVQAKIIHTSNGSAGHTLNVDEIFLDEGFVQTTITGLRRVYNFGEDIGLAFQLFEDHGTIIDDASITYTIYETDGTTVAVSGSAPWNNTLKSYFNELDVSVDWASQISGNYLLTWNVSGAAVATPIIEEMCILEMVPNSKVDKILGLSHENVYIDQTTYDSNSNLVSARVRIYSVAGSVGTSSDVINTYTITSVGSGAGKFLTWKQVRQ
jgi:hypothetical protein